MLALSVTGLCRFRSTRGIEFQSQRHVQVPLRGGALVVPRIGDLLVGPPIDVSSGVSDDEEEWPGPPGGPAPDKMSADGWAAVRTRFRDWADG